MDLNTASTIIAHRYAGDVEHLFGITDVDEGAYFLKGFTFVLEYHMGGQATFDAADDVLGFLNESREVEAWFASEVRSAREDALDDFGGFSDRDYMDSLT